MKKTVETLLFLGIIFICFVQSISANDTEPTYYILNNYVSISTLKETGFKQISDYAWESRVTEDRSYYLWISRNNIYAEAVVFHFPIAEITHDSIAAYIENYIDRGYVFKEVKCITPNSEICKSVYESMVNIYTLPITIYSTIYSNVYCALSQIVLL